MTFAHVMILFSFMQWVEEYLVALKEFDYSGSLRYERHKDKMNIARDLKLNDLFLSFLLFLRRDICLKTILRYLCKVLIPCDFLNLGCLRILAMSQQP